ncbi:MAG: 30S ribosomal protein S1, partial [Oscillospiraceae bacterium]
IGCGLASMIPIDAISISRIAHPRDRFRVGQSIRAVVRTLEPNRVCLSHKELLGTWEENASRFSPGETVAGIIRSVESYGVFVELTPNLAGLAEPREGVRCAQHASVFIKSLIPQKMKVKLILIDAFDADYPPSAPDYWITEGRLTRWRYSPDCADRVLETIFCPASGD